MSIKINTLQEFVVLIRHQNYCSAAKELFCSQPNLSNHMAGLEKELGFKLFTRFDNQLHLTPAGSEFLKSAQVILDTWGRTLDSCRTLAKTTPPIRMQALRPASNEYHIFQQIKDIPFVFVDIGSEMTVFEALERGFIDVGVYCDFTTTPALVEEARSKGLSWFEIGEFEFVICFMRTHSLASKQQLQREDLRGQMVRVHSRSQFDHWCQCVLAYLGNDLELSFMLDPVESLTNISHEDLGDAIYICGRDSTVELRAHRDDVVICTQLTDLNFKHPFQLVYRNDTKLNQLSDFLNRVQKLSAKTTQL